ncbi:unnamed protein product [Plutella xylostella]|uniref:(diamondback moth) hypothetical protein n=1 Tax=Plutella xylostella TaxID=51655 RepID=A0A8S4G4G7_PLUXY|nr:unnamed protein product [Plutella xylostella]
MEISYCILCERDGAYPSTLRGTQRIVESETPPAKPRRIDFRHAQCAAALPTHPRAAENAPTLQLHFSAYEYGAKNQLKIRRSCEKTKEKRKKNISRLCLAEKFKIKTFHLRIRDVGGSRE